MVSSELIARLSEARRRVPGDTWRQLSLRLAACPGVPEAASITHATAGLLNRDAAWILSKGFQESAHAPWTEIAAAMVAVEYLVGDSNPLTEIIWTGPTNGRFPVRRVDQVLYDLVSSAKKRMILVTFAAHRVRHLCAHLTQAVERGVDLELIVESEGESEGQLTLDAIAAFSGVPNTRTRLYYWPLAKRERNSAGRPGKLHVKCAVIDDVALVGSANLTDDAFNRNMELGLLVHDVSIVRAISDHFEQLIRRGTLVEVRLPPQ
jgi:phosphatidylserine/phosphatidylglycerophosphate/cardiolipin synthase-like enzyme